MIKKCMLSKVEELQKICCETFKETFGNQNSKEDIQKFLKEAYDKEVLIKELSDSESETYLVYKEEKVIAYLKINTGNAQTEKEYENSLEIQRIYVLNEFKGQHIGSELIELAEKRAKEWNLDYIWLGVWEYNYPAIDFYKSKGFKKFSEHVFVLGEDRQTDYLMRKNV